MTGQSRIQQVSKYLKINSELLIGNECPFKNDRVTTNSGHFFEICMFIFHKTEVQTVIMTCLTGLNSNKFWLVQKL